MTANQQDNMPTEKFFGIKNYSMFDTATPRYKPNEIGFYSLDVNRKFLDSDKSLRYYVKPENPEKVHFDLREGFETRMIKEKGRDINILYWINEHLDTLSPEGQTSNRYTFRKLDADFVTQRGLLSRLMFTPYEENDGWFIAVTLYNGTYYLNEVESDEKRAREARIKDDEESCWGWKFEQYVTGDSQNGKPNTDVPYNNLIAYYTVVKSDIKRHSLVFSGEIDAVKIDRVKGNSYIEFKTTKDFRKERRHLRNFQRYKSLKFWVQSYLTGVKEIVCGFKHKVDDEDDKECVVKRMVTFKTENMPGFARDGSDDPWKPNVCLNYLDEFLTTIKSKITRDDYRIVYTLKWDPHKPVMISQPLKDSEYSFLPEWYVDRIGQSKN